ncbi:hypothetical protein A2318_02340 [Candidatus Uhrbacteria bacterium RIFOXYB2_FULL_45_11]|uniref:Uncharacterized protein n=1 Tax=Candidatus Uhrbacteria bacterium RIFOXYB2_FULL_45_11 TaxID=1802421 RepID=A0A1F7W555_9BACT|nr:MAG: hypothetical protein A2318_02340 [Candidatus Uhrbacteria bacterium RIFOXYB2_FULL_45_11]
MYTSENLERWGKSIMSQANDLQRLFPGINVACGNQLFGEGSYWKNLQQVLPNGATYLAIFPKHSVLARYATGNETWPVYNRALAHTLAIMKQTRTDFVDWSDGRIGPENERMTTATKDVFDELEKRPGDVIALAIQTGILHCNESARNVQASFGGQEFGLDSVSASSFLLVHPKRLMKYEHLGIDCPGSERVHKNTDQFDHTSCFSFRDGNLGFGARPFADPHPCYGSASAFLPALKVKS